MENINIEMFNGALFHDLTLPIFPILLHFWRIFCEKRYEYVPRATLLQMRRDNILNRHKSKVRERRQSSIKLFAAPLIDYCASEQYEESRVDVTKTLGKYCTYTLQRKNVKKRKTKKEKKNTQ